LETPRWLDTLGPRNKGKRPFEPKDRKHDNLDLLVDLENYLGKALAPYEEFVVGEKTYYLSLGGFVHRKENPRGGKEGRHFCGYFDDDF
jgi:hypothetical protein